MARLQVATFREAVAEETVARTAAAAAAAAAALEAAVARPSQGSAVACASRPATVVPKKASTAATAVAVCPAPLPRLSDDEVIRQQPWTLHPRLGWLAPGAAGNIGGGDAGGDASCPATPCLDPPRFVLGLLGPAPVPLKDDLRYAKYFKMLLKMKLPAPAVKRKMAAEGLDPGVLDLDPEGMIPVPLRDDPKFAKYFKMLLQVKLPAPAVKRKMAAEGLDPGVLDLDPNGPAPARMPELDAPVGLVETDPRWFKNSDGGGGSGGGGGGSGGGGGWPCWSLSHAGHLLYHGHDRPPATTRAAAAEAAWALGLASGGRIFPNPGAAVVLVPADSPRAIAWHVAWSAKAEAGAVR